MMSPMPELPSKRAEQLRLWDQELAREGRVEVGYGGRSVLWTGLLLAGFTAIGVWMALTGDAFDRVVGIGCVLLFGGGGVAALVMQARPGTPLIVDHQGVHLRKPRKQDVPWETVRNAYVLRSLEGPTVALVVVRPDGSTTSVELGRLVGRDRKALAAWLATEARAPQP